MQKLGKNLQRRKNTEPEGVCTTRGRPEITTGGLVQKLSFLIGSVGPPSSTEPLPGIPGQPQSPGPKLLTYRP